MTAASRPQAPETVDWSPAPPGWPALVLIAGLLAVALILPVQDRMRDDAGVRGALRQVDLAVVLLGADYVGPEADVVVRLRVRNDGPFPVVITFREILLPGLPPQAAAGADRVEATGARDITIPLAAYRADSPRGDGGTVRLEVSTLDGASRVLDLPLRWPAGQG